MITSPWLDITREQHLPRFTAFQNEDVWRLTYEEHLRLPGSATALDDGWFLWPPNVRSLPIRIDATDVEEAKNQAERLVAALTAPDPAEAPQ